MSESITNLERARVITRHVEREDTAKGSRIVKTQYYFMVDASRMRELSEDSEAVLSKTCDYLVGFEEFLEHLESPF